MKYRWTDCGHPRKSLLDFVIRQFQFIFGTAEYAAAVGTFAETPFSAIPRSNWSLRVSRSEAPVQTRLVRMIPWFRAKLDCS